MAIQKERKPSKRPREDQDGDHFGSPSASDLESSRELVDSTDNLLGEIDNVLEPQTDNTTKSSNVDGGTELDVTKQTGSSDKSEDSIFRKEDNDDKNSSLAERLSPRNIKGFASRNKKILGFVGGSGLVGVAAGAFFFIAQLNVGAHIFNNLSNFNDRRPQRIMNSRFNRMYKPVFETTNAKFDGFKKRGGLLAKIGNINRERFVSDLRSNAGFDFEFNGNGSLARITIDGDEYANFEDASNKLRRAKTRDVVDDIYPSKSAFWRWRKARALHTRLGITRQPFERIKTDSRVDVDFAEAGELRRRSFLQKFNGNLYGDEAVDDIRLSRVDGTEPPADGEVDPAESVRSDIDRELGGIIEQGEEYTKALIEDPEAPNPLKNGVLSRTSVSGSLSRGVRNIAGDFAQNTAVRVFTGFMGSGLATALDVACEVLILATLVEEGATVMRTEALAEVAGELEAGIQSTMLGETNSDDAAELNLLFLGRGSQADFSSAPAWQYITGDETAELDDYQKENYSLDGGNLGLVQGVLENIPNDVLGACRVFTNIFFQVGAALVSAVVSIVSFGTFEGVDVSAAAAAAVFESVFYEAARPLAIRLVAGTVITGFEEPQDMLTAYASGRSALTTLNSMSSLGAQPLTNAEVVALNKQLDQEQRELDATKTLWTRLIDFDDHRSFASRVVYERGSGVRNMVNPKTVVATMFNDIKAGFDSVAGLIVPGYSQVAYANGDPNALAKDIFGVPQVGITVEMLEEFENDESFGIEENAKYIEDDAERWEKYQKYESDCINPSTVTLYLENRQEKCDAKDELTRRFIAYHVDEVNIENIVEFTNGAFSSSVSEQQTTTNNQYSDNPAVLAQQILIYADEGLIGFDPGKRDTFEAMAAGGNGIVNANNAHWELRQEGVMLDVRLMQLVIAIAEQGIQQNISSSTDGNHSAGSKHYSGRALDWNKFNGKDGPILAEFLEIAGPIANQLGIRGGRIGFCSGYENDVKAEYSQQFTFFADGLVDGGGCNHIHFDLG